jgi:hypothetical protein
MRDMTSDRFDLVKTLGIQLRAILCGKSKTTLGLHKTAYCTG